MRSTALLLTKNCAGFKGAKVFTNQMCRIGFFTLNNNQNVSLKIINSDNIKHFSDYFSLVNLGNYSEGTNIGNLFREITNNHVRYVLLNDIFNPIELFRYRNRFALDVNFIVYPYTLVLYKEYCSKMAGYLQKEDIIISFSNFLRNVLKNIPCKCIMPKIPVSIDTKEFRRSDMGPKKELKILFCGRIIPEKGLHLILMALDMLKNNCRFSLHIITPRESLNQKEIKYYMLIKKIISQYGLDRYVKFYGSLINNQNKRREIFSEADVLVYLSTDREETFGRNIVEGFAAGLAVIISDWQAINELVVNDRNGIVVPIKGSHGINVQEIALAIIKMYDRKLLNRFKQNNYLKSKEYDYRPHMKELRKIIGLNTSKAK